MNYVLCFFIISFEVYKCTYKLIHLSAIFQRFYLSMMTPQEQIHKNRSEKMKLLNRWSTFFQVGLEGSIFWYDSILLGILDVSGYFLKWSNFCAWNCCNSNFSIVNMYWNLKISDFNLHHYMLCVNDFLDVCIFEWWNVILCN